MYNPNLANQIAQASPKYNAWLEEGNHTLALSQVREDMSDPLKPTIYVDFVYIESDTQPVGTSCSQSYRLWEHGKFPGGLATSLTDLRHLIAALAGDNDAQKVGAYSAAAIGQNAARGVLVRCIATDKSRGKLQADGVTPKKKFVSPLFYHKEGQTPEAIQAMRGYLDTVSPEKQAAPAPQAPVAYAAPAPQAPVAYAPPVAAPVAYAPPVAAPVAYAPPVAAPAPVAYAPPVAPPVAAPVAYAPPVAAPVAAPVAYAPPVAAPVAYAPPVAAPAAAPPGVASLPTFPIPGL